MRCSRKYQWWGREKKLADVLQQRVLSLDSEMQEHVDQRVEVMDTLVKHELFSLYNLSTDLLDVELRYDAARGLLSPSFSQENFIGY